MIPKQSFIVHDLKQQQNFKNFGYRLVTNFLFLFVSLRISFVYFVHNSKKLKIASTSKVSLLEICISVAFFSFYYMQKQHEKPISSFTIHIAFFGIGQCSMSCEHATLSSIAISNLYIHSFPAETAFVVTATKLDTNNSRNGQNCFCELSKYQLKQLKKKRVTII